MEFSYTKSTDTSTNMVTKDYSKSRMRENRTYGSVRGGQSNLIPSTRLTAALPLRVVVGAIWTSPAGLRVDGPLGRRFLRGLSLTRLWREGCCRAPLNYRRRPLMKKPLQPPCGRRKTGQLLWRARGKSHRRWLIIVMRIKLYDS